MMPGPAPVMIAKPASASRRATSCAAWYCGSSGCVRAEPKIDTPPSTSREVVEPLDELAHDAHHAPRIGAREVVARRSAPGSSFSSSVTGAHRSCGSTSSTISRVAPDGRAWRLARDGGVRPAARWPASVRSRNPSCAPIWRFGEELRAGFACRRRCAHRLWLLAARRFGFVGFAAPSP